MPIEDLDKELLELVKTTPIIPKKPEGKLTIHTIPVPEGMSIEMTWEYISRGEIFSRKGKRGWANVLIENNKIIEVLPAE